MYTIERIKSCRADENHEITEAQSLNFRNEIVMRTQTRKFLKINNEAENLTDLLEYWDASWMQWKWK
jgi:hypothetical protein